MEGHRIQTGSVEQENEAAPYEPPSVEDVETDGKTLATAPGLNY